MAKTFKIENKDTNRKAVGVYDEDLDEWCVKFYIDGKHQKRADYFTNDRDDAVGTAKLEVNRTLLQAARA